MTKILIKDMPMINNVDVELKKLNVLIGFDDDCIYLFKKILGYCFEIETYITNSYNKGIPLVHFVQTAETLMCNNLRPLTVSSGTIIYSSDIMLMSYSLGSVSIEIFSIPRYGGKDIIFHSSNVTHPIESKFELRILIGKLSYNKIHILETDNIFLLHAINNYIMHSLIKDKMPASEQAKLQCKYAFLEPEDVLILQAEKSCMKCVQTKDGLIGDNCIDDEIKRIKEEQRLMSQYYKYPE